VEWIGWDPNVKVTEAIQVSGALVAFVIALWQYIKSQRWKRAEFVAGEVKSFLDDIAVKTVLTMLDWGQREIQLYRYDDDASREGVLVDRPLLSSALMIHVEHGPFSREEAAIRDIFDRFLSGLERFESFIEAGLVSERDFVPYLHYWTNALAGNDPGLSGGEVLSRFWKFVDFYGYRGVRSLVSRYHEVRYPEREGN
jgi:hypothetical protein